MEYLIALLTTLALELPALTGQPIPEMSSLPALEVADHLDQMVFAHTGQWAGGELTTAAYMPRENLILVTNGLLDDLPEMEAVLVHELVHWWQVQGHAAGSHGLPAWEEEARGYENRWRREHGLSPRSELSGPVRHHP
jgi:predicted TIM-barrel fold metal-dependent hydrolase